MSETGPFKYYELFYKNLTNKLRNENRLSDVTISMCQTSKWFSKSFLDFFFRDLNLKGNTNLWEREYTSEIDSSRVDFYYEEDDKKIVIENKIWDQNTHAEQYKIAFSDDKGYTRAFIANYRFPDPTDKTYKSKKTWREFKEYLDELMKDFSGDGDEKSLIESYIKYIAVFLRIMEIKQMNFSNLNSITSFFRLVDKVVEGNKYGIYSSGREKIRFEDTWIFKRYLDIKENTYWIGLEFSEEPSIEIYVYNPNRSKKDYESLVMSLKCTKHNKEKVEYYDDCYAGVWGGNFSMSEEMMNEFNGKNTTNEEKQEECFKKFFDEVVEAVQKI